MIRLTRQTIEKYQVLIYFAAVGSGLIVGMAQPMWLGTLEAMLRPVLALLLYTTFTQVPLAHLRESIADRRFILAAVVGNFLIVPALVAGLAQFLPGDVAIRLGVLMVLLVPCTDWFITFTHLGGGDTRRAIAFAPVSLLLQGLLLPLYLWLFLDEALGAAMLWREMLIAFGSLILLPLLGAWLTERWAEGEPRRRGMLGRLAWFPLPLLAVVVFTIAATQVNLVAGSLAALGRLLLIFVAYLLLAGLIARGLARAFRLPTAQGRVLAFSLGTRNSFVVLPLALALPPAFGLAVVAIVFQSLVELVGMVTYLWWVPRRLFPEAARSAAREDTTRRGALADAAKLSGQGEHLPLPTRPARQAHHLEPSE